MGLRTVTRFADHGHNTSSRCRTLDAGSTDILCSVCVTWACASKHQLWRWDRRTAWPAWHKCRQAGSCSEDGMKACTADAGARIGTDWISELMDSDLDVNDLQVSVVFASIAPATTGPLLLM